MGTIAGRSVTRGENGEVNLFFVGVAVAAVLLIVLFLVISKK